MNISKCMPVHAHACLFEFSRVTVSLRYYSKDYIQDFMAEATSFLLRNAPVDQLKNGRTFQY